MKVDKENILEGLDYKDMVAVSNKFIEMRAVAKEFEKIADELKTKIKIFMKEKKWNSYKPDDNISIKITRTERQIIDKDKLKMLLTKDQIENISKYSSTERITITTKEQREKMDRFINQK